MLLLLLFSSLSYAKILVSQEVLLHSDTKKKVEFFWAKPNDDIGPWPLLVLLHPQQNWPHNIGGRYFVNSQAVENWTRKGWVTVAVSELGYGGSAGPPDFAGYTSQTAVLDVVKYLHTKNFVKPKVTVYYGEERGAILAGLTATRQPSSSGVILRGGFFDLVSTFRALPFFSRLKLNAHWELGIYYQDELQKRNITPIAYQIQAPILVVRSGADAENFVSSVKNFTKGKTVAELATGPERQAIEAFLEKIHDQ